MSTTCASVAAKAAASGNIFSIDLVFMNVLLFIMYLMYALIPLHKTQYDRSTRNRVTDDRMNNFGFDIDVTKCLFVTFVIQMVAYSAICVIFCTFFCN